MTQNTNLSVAIGTAVTPIIVYLLARVFPIRHNAEFTFSDYDTLKKRHGWIDVTATFVALGSLITPMFFFDYVPENRAGWLVALAFGLMVIGPFVWICAITLPFGTRHFREFWRFYELRWGIGIKGIRFIYFPIAGLGIFAMVKLWL